MNQEGLARVKTYEREAKYQHFPHEETLKESSLIDSRVDKNRNIEMN